MKAAALLLPCLAASLGAGSFRAGTSRPRVPGEAVIFVAVADKAGKPVRGLAPAMFEITRDGQDASILDVRQATEPISLVVVTDGIGIDDAGRVRSAVKGVLSTIDQRSPKSRVGLMLTEPFQVPRLHGLPSSDLSDALNHFFQSGTSSYLLENTTLATQSLSREATPRRIILALVSTTSGVPPPTRDDGSGVLDALARTGTSLWNVELMPFASRRAEGRLGRAVILSGGRSAIVFDSLAFKEASQRDVSLMLSEYRITYAAPLMNGLARVQVRVRTKGAQVFAPVWERPADHDPK